MSRWIDADALIEHITNTADLGGWIGEALQQIKKVAIKYINLAPSIDIVRCKECRLNESDVCPMVYYTPLEDGDIETRWWSRPDDFCSWGGRKDDE